MGGRPTVGSVEWKVGIATGDTRPAKSGTQNWSRIFAALGPLSSFPLRNLRDRIPALLVRDIVTISNRALS